MPPCSAALAVPGIQTLDTMLESTLLRSQELVTMLQVLKTLDPQHQSRKKDDNQDKTYMMSKKA